MNILQIRGILLELEKSVEEKYEKYLKKQGSSGGHLKDCL